MDGDYSSILSGLAVTGAVSAIIGAGVLKAAPGFARWLTNKVATFFR
ncbi:capsid protein [Xanthomonas campestris pv. raphani]